jgi:hypothetical protein
LQNSLQDLKETETFTFRNIGDGTCDGREQTTSVPGFSKT